MVEKQIKDTLQAFQKDTLQANNRDNENQAIYQQFQSALYNNQYNIEQDEMSILSLNYMIQCYQQAVNKIPIYMKVINELQVLKQEQMQQIKEKITCQLMGDLDLSDFIDEQYLKNISYYMEIVIQTQEYQVKALLKDQTLLNTLRGNIIDYRIMPLFNIIRNERNLAKNQRNILQQTINDLNKDPIYNNISMLVDTILNQVK